MALPLIDPIYASNTGGSGTITIGEPGGSGVSPGEAALIFIASDNNNPGSQIFDGVTNKPTGFTLIAEHGLNGGNNQDCQGAVYIRAIDGTESWPITCTTNGGSGLIVQAVRLSNVDVGALINQIGAVSEINGTGSSITLSGVTTGADDCTVFYFNSTDGADTLPHSQDGSWTEGAELGDDGGAAGTAFSWGYLELPTAGDSGDVTVSFGSTDGRGGFQFAIKGASPSGNIITASLTDDGDTASAAFAGVISVSSSQSGQGDTAAVTIKVINEITANQTDSGSVSALVSTQQISVVTASFDDSDNPSASIQAVIGLTGALADSDTSAATLQTFVELSASVTDSDDLSALVQVITELTASLTDSDTVAAGLLAQQASTITAALDDIDNVSASMQALVSLSAALTDDDVVAAVISPQQLSVVSASLTDSDDLIASIQSVASLSASQSDVSSLTALISTHQLANITASIQESGDTVQAYLDNLVQITANQTESDTISAELGNVANIYAALTELGDIQSAELSEFGLLVAVEFSDELVISSHTKPYVVESQSKRHTIQSQTKHYSIQTVGNA